MKKTNLSLFDLTEQLGVETVLTEIEQWLPTDQLNALIQDIIKDYDLDYFEDLAEE